jgi:hypothetical protein
VWAPLLLVESYRLLACVWHQDRGVLIERLTAEVGPRAYGAGDHQRHAEREHADADHETPPSGPKAVKP